MTRGMGVRNGFVQLDVEDVLASAVGSMLGRLVLFGVAVWIGCAVGGAAMTAGRMTERESLELGEPDWLWECPLLLVSSWLILNVPFLLICLLRFVRNEGDGFLLWGVVVAGESLAAMAGWTGEVLDGWMPRTVAWVVWALILAMAGSGIWLLRQHSINCWARDLAMLRAANAQKRAGREAGEPDQATGDDPT